MKKTLFVSTAILVATASVATADRDVRNSFDGIVEQVLDNADNATSQFTSVAVNYDDIDASVNVDMSADFPAGSLEGGLISVDGVYYSDQDYDLNTNGASQLVDDTTFVKLDGFGAMVNMTVAPVTATFGDITTVAAGAINDGTFNLTETGASVNSSADALTGTFDGAASFSETVGSGIEVSSVGVNYDDIDASINVNMSNVSLTTANVSTTAAGAINTTDVTASFLGAPSEEDDRDRRDD